MDLSFYKLRVCEADLLLVDDLAGKGRDRDWAAAARSLLDRRRGAGADRLAVLSKAEEAVWLRAFDREGEPAACLFDAALCAARYLLDSGRSGSESVELRVPRGSLVVDVLDASSLGLSLGPPRGLPSGEALDLGAAAARKSLIEAGGERYEVLPLCIGGRGAQEDETRPGERAETVAVFCEGGTRKVKARIGASARGAKAPPPLAVRLVARGELWAEIPRGLDAAATAGLALAAAAAAGYADREAVVRLPGGAVFVEWAESGSLYAAARPEYAYRGEFHLDEPEGE
ncbi:MAG TPA: hypothetical protein P5165_06295 [Spirochaetia bacterium]|nr:hypothetical protein [Spirochaetales bacterium]HRY72817.1 hypothetical protein [Spirochaetia bacterium]